MEYDEIFDEYNHTKERIDCLLRKAFESKNSSMQKWYISECIFQLGVALEIERILDVCFKKNFIEEHVYMYSIKSYLQRLLTKNEESDYIWASEYWTKEDLIAALEYHDIEPNDQNIEKLLQECIGMFDDKTYRTEEISNKVYKAFSI